MQNQNINGYTLKQKLGEGGMAEVWYAENRLGKPASIKILKPALALMPEIVTRFENEAQVMVSLEHPNIRQVHDYSSINERPCIIMEYLEGADMGERLKNGERFRVDDLKQFWNQTVDALNYTHAAGVVHRDIKPSNIFLTNKGKIKLLDFGIAKIKDSLTLTQTGTRMGTLLYMSPEQVEDSKHVSHKTDVYSLAVTFYHLLSGRSPYDTETMSAFQIQVKIVGESLDISHLVEPWNSFLQSFLSKSPRDRSELCMFSAKKESKPKVPAIPITETEKHDTDQLIMPEQADEEVSENQNNFLHRFTQMVENIAFDMILVSGGKFLWGSNEMPNEQPVQEQEVADFYIATTPVTQELWQAVMDNNPSAFRDDKRPVENVSWNDAKMFIDELNRLTRRNYRLPSENEWEYAAGGGIHKTEIWSGTNHEYQLPDYCWYSFNSKKRTSPVASLKPNILGLYDMSGNVCEWCEDDYYATDMEITYYKSPSPYKVLKGGSWFYKAFHCRVSSRFYEIPGLKNSLIGFRLALSPQNDGDYTLIQ